MVANKGIVVNHSRTTINSKEMKSVKKISKFVSFVLVLVVILSIPANAQENKVKVIVDGSGVDIETILENDRTFVPLDTLGEKLDFVVEYNGNHISLLKDNIKLSLDLNSSKVIVNDQELESDVKPLLKGEDIFVPLRFIAESMGKDVTWDGNNYNVLIGEFSQEANIEDTFIYYNEKYGYTLNFPNSLKDEAIIETKDGALYVYDKKSAERFIEDGYESYGPVFEIRLSDYSLTAGLTYSDNYVLDYSDGKYIEALFGSDFQFYPETVDSYKKIYDEGLKMLGSFRNIDEEYGIIEEVLHDILDNYVPSNIFNKDEIFTYNRPVENNSFLYMRNIGDDNEISIKIESDFDNKANLIRYHLKSYYHEFEERQLTQDEALKLANEFVHKYVDEYIELKKMSDLYPSLYEKDKHETYGDEDGKYMVAVDLVHGFVEYYNLQKSYANVEVQTLEEFYREAKIENVDKTNIR